jgi:hypothetical protein
MTEGVWRDEERLALDDLFQGLSGPYLVDCPDRS